MTRFKEQRRINAAIEHENESELRWALWYCSMRLNLALTVTTMRRQEKHWKAMEARVRKAIERIGCDKVAE